MPSLSRLGGGIVSSAARLAQSLDADVEVFGLRDQFADEDLVQWSPLKARAFSVRGPQAFGYAPELGNTLKNARAEIVHAHGLWLYTSIAAQKSQKPNVISPHGMLDAWALENSRWKKRIAAALFENAHLREAACLHALCDAEAKSIRAYGLKSPVCVIPNGVDLPATAVAEKKRDAKKTLLYLGRIHPKKGLANLLHAWKEAASDEWRLVIAGWDQHGHETELQRLAQQLGCADRVDFTGSLFGAKKAAAYENCDAFILPSLSEGLPMVVLEAWAHTKPALITPQCNLPEGFSASAAMRIEPTPDSIAQGLCVLFSKPDDELRAMGQCGRDLVERKFAWPKIAAEMLAIYRWILGDAAKPASVLE